MKDALPAAFCKNGTYFRQCFEVTAEDCHKEAREGTESCLLQLKSEIPDQLSQPHDGRKWGERVGTCAGTLYEQGLADKRISSAACNNPDSWR